MTTRNFRRRFLATMDTIDPALSQRVARALRETGGNYERAIGLVIHEEIQAAERAAHPPPVEPSPKT
jgi:hypothetical protein